MVMWEQLERERKANGGEGPEKGICTLAQKRLKLRIEEVKPENFVEALFCRIDMHRRDMYRRRIKLLMEGTFNGMVGWERQL